jgi:hypothetical protein
MTEGPIRAAHVEAETKLTDDELEAQKRKKAVASRLAKRAGMRAGGATGLGTGNPVRDAEDRLARLNTDAMDSFRQRKAARDAVERRIG